MTVKNQHYVPQSYLKYFANSKQIWIYDTIAKKSFSNSIASIANAAFFYDIEELDEIAEGKQVIEKELFAKNIEPAFESLLNYIRTTYFLTPNIHNQNVFIDENIVLDTASHIIAQYRRTKQSRENIHFIANQLAQFMGDAIGNANFPEYTAGQVKVEVNESWIKKYQIRQLLDLKQISTLAQQLYQFIWIVGVNETEQPFLTSDTPVVSYNHRDKSTKSLSLLPQGTEIAFPISNNLIIIMYEPTYFQKMKPYDRNFLNINSKEQIRYYNHLQVLQSQRQVFCIDNKFDVISEMLKENPHILEEKAKPPQVIFQQL